MGNTDYLKDAPVRNWLRYHFLEKKLNTRFGYLFFAILAAIFVYGIVVVNFVAAPVVLAATSAILLCIAIMKNPYFGFYFLLVFSSINVAIDRLIVLPAPSGNAVEILTYLVLFSVVTKYDLKKNIDRRFWTNPITICMYILFAYYLVELFNPEMLSPLGWFSFFRKQFSYFIFYYLCYSLLNSRARIIYFVRFMIILTTILALYACKQQWFGYAGFELSWIGTGNGYSLLLQGGMLRKFSVFSDPSTSGILFAGIALLCTILYFRSTDKKEKTGLVIAIFFNVLGYGYSGTRTATLMIVAGILMYGIASIHERRTARFMLYSVTVFMALMFSPHQNAITNRIRSTFAGTRDASAAIRDYDRHEVQPYIQAHPMGGGIFTSGREGNKYNQGHYIEYLQADSGYLKTLAEQGAIGFAFLLIFYFTIMRRGFHHFFRVYDPELRTYYIGLLVMMFTLMVAQYSQMSISQYPVVLYFYAVLAIFIKLADFDKPVQTAETIEI